MFGQWLKQRRKALDITQEDLAERTNCAVSTIYKIEAGVRRPSRQVAALLAEHLQIPPQHYDAFITFARTGVTSAVFEAATVTEIPHSLPAISLPFVGRDTALTDLRKRLSRTDTRLITLIGPPGVGKTGLSVALGHAVLKDFADGVFFVPLASAIEVDDFPGALARVIGIAESGGKNLSDSLTAYFAERHALLILDNCEHLPELGAVLDALLTACPSLKLVATSRAPLNSTHQQRWPVAPLDLPVIQPTLNLDDVAHAPAVTLFLTRANEARPGFTLTPENAASVAEICTRVDGLPLALELVAPRLKLLAPDALAERLRGRLLLESDSGNDHTDSQLPTNRTLNAAIGWSYNLLDDLPRTIFRSIGVFSGGFTLEAVEAVCADIDRADVYTAVETLLEQTLITEVPGSAPRFTLLETLGAFAREQLHLCGETEATSRAHAQYFAQFAERADHELRHGDQMPWYKRVEADYDNLYAALRWSLDANEDRLLLRLASALGRFWLMRSYNIQEALDWLHRALKTSSDPTHERAKALYYVGIFGWMTAREGARAAFDESLAIFQALNDIGWTASTTLSILGIERSSDMTRYEEVLRMYQSVNDLGGMAFVLRAMAVYFNGVGDVARCLGLLDESEAITRELNDLHSLAMTLHYKGSIMQNQGDLEESFKLYAESLAITEKTGNRHRLATILNGLGGISVESERYDEARDYFMRAAQAARASGIPFHMNWAHCYLGEVLLIQGDTPRAQINFEKALRGFRASGAVDGIARTLGKLAMIALQAGDLTLAGERCAEVLTIRASDARAAMNQFPETLRETAYIALNTGYSEQGVQLFAAAEAQRIARKERQPVVHQQHDAETITALRSALSPETFETVWASGTALTPEAALALAASVVSMFQK